MVVDGDAEQSAFVGLVDVGGPVAGRFGAGEAPASAIADELIFTDDDGADDSDEDDGDDDGRSGLRPVPA